jgi:hypothetical protein
MKTARVFEKKTESNSEVRGETKYSEENFWDITVTETELMLSKTESYSNYLNSYDSDYENKVWSISVPLPNSAFPFKYEPDQEPWEFLKFAKGFLEINSSSALNQLIESATEASLTIDYFYRRYEGSGMFELTEFDCKFAFSSSLDLYFLVARKNDHWAQFEIDFPISKVNMSQYSSLSNLLNQDIYEISDLLDKLKDWDETQVNTIDGIFDGPSGGKVETIDFRKITEEQLRIYCQIGITGARQELKQRIGLDPYQALHEYTPSDLDYFHLWKMVHPDDSQ